MLISLPNPEEAKDPFDKQLLEAQLKAVKRWVRGHVDMAHREPIGGSDELAESVKLGPKSTRYQGDPAIVTTRGWGRSAGVQPLRATRLIEAHRVEIERKAKDEGVELDIETVLQMALELWRVEQEGLRGRNLAGRIQEITARNIAVLAGKEAQHIPHPSQMPYWIFQHAIRHTAQGQALDMLMRAPSGKKTGRPSPRALPAAVAMLMLTEDITPHFRRCYQQLALGRFESTQWAQDFPADHGAREESSTFQTLMGVYKNAQPSEEDPTKYEPGYWKQRGIIGREVHDWADIFGRLNHWAAVELHQAAGIPLTDLAVSIDGAVFASSKEPRKSVSELDEDLLNGHMTSATHGTHDEQNWIRGHNIVSLNLIPSGVAENFSLTTMAATETSVVGGMLERSFRYHDELMADPPEGIKPEDFTIRYLVGDKHFNTKAMCGYLVFNQGIIPAFPWKKDMAKQMETPDGKPTWAENMGVPYCSCGGTKKDMRQEEVNYFPDAAYRAKLSEKLVAQGDAPLRPGDDVLEAIKKVKGARKPEIRYVCQTCGIGETMTLTRDNVHINTVLPYKNVHMPNGGNQDKDRYLIRKDLLGQRNASETLNSVLRRRGLAANGALKAKWVSNPERLRFLTYGRLWATTMRKLVWFTGALQNSYLEAEELGLLRPSSPEEREVLYRMHQAKREQELRARQAGDAGSGSGEEPESQAA